MSFLHSVYGTVKPGACMKFSSLKAMLYCVLCHLHAMLFLQHAVCLSQQPADKVLSGNISFFNSCNHQQWKKHRYHYHFDLYTTVQRLIPKKGQT